MAKKTTRKKATTKKKRAKRQPDEAEILTNLQLGLAEVPVHQIRVIVSGGMNRVTKITRQLNAAKKTKKK